MTEKQLVFAIRRPLNNYIGQWHIYAKLKKPLTVSLSIRSISSSSTICFASLFSCLKGICLQYHNIDKLITFNCVNISSLSARKDAFSKFQSVHHGSYIYFTYHLFIFFKVLSLYIFAIFFHISLFTQQSVWPNEIKRQRWVNLLFVIMAKLP